jgi:hypothetical protein
MAAHGHHEETPKPLPIFAIAIVVAAVLLGRLIGPEEH